MAEWTPEQVAERFREAAQTAHRLPPVRVQGYFNTWPTIVRLPWETLSMDDVIYRMPPDPAAIDRMEETMGGCCGSPRRIATCSGCGRRDIVGGISACGLAVTGRRLGDAGNGR